MPTSAACVVAAYAVLVRLFADRVVSQTKLAD